MKTIALLILLSSSLSHAFSSGRLSCFFEIMTTKNPGHTYVSEQFSFDIKEHFTEAFTFDYLENRILMAYYPGVTKPGDVEYFSFLLKYNGANAGADVPAVKNGFYYTNIGKDGTDLLGAFMKCTPQNLQ